ncbi:sigma-54-dependent Fis family transcriptional regulator [candidate division FCPU426 bacterium]|nr:sigma-54-dependent Fis family transcriptional regulator [candidate division FCPU426 bacterium]
MPKVLIVNDQSEIAESFKDLLKNEGFLTSIALTESEAYQAMQAFIPDIVLLDIALNGDEQDRSGISILSWIRERWTMQEMPVIVISQYLNREVVDQLEKLGMNDYESYPISELQFFLRKVKAILKPAPPPPVGPNPPEEKEADPCIRSAAMIEVDRKVKKNAQLHRDILFLGEPGTGKTHWARYYHKLLEQNAGGKLAWVQMTCPAIPETIFEAHLFGTKKNAYTDAVDMPGYVELAGDGVLFLDEIGSIPLEVQVKILRLMDDKKFRRLGDSQEQTFKGVIIAATYVDLTEKLQKGELDEAFARRLSRQTIIRIPPLRERPQDIDELIRHFSRHFFRKYSRNITHIDKSVFEILRNERLPYNASDVEAIIEDGVIHCVDEILVAADLKESIESRRILNHSAEGGGQAATRFRSNYHEFCKYTEDLERAYIMHHYLQNNKNKTKTANAIGVRRERLYDIFKRLKIDFADDNNS